MTKEIGEVEEEVFKLTDKMIDPIYATYPRKEGKRMGYEKLKRTIKSESELQTFKGAVENYRKLFFERGARIKYTLIFSTFVNSRWEDYVTLEDDLTFDTEDLFDD